mgnify:CR=1 FL=1
MSQNFEMKINPLPAKTWNWLHMNGTVLKEEIITERETVKADRPETVTETECRMENLIKPETQVKSETQIETAEDCAQKKKESFSDKNRRGNRDGCICRCRKSGMAGFHIQIREKRKPATQTHVFLSG